MNKQHLVFSTALVSGIALSTPAFSEENTQTIQTDTSLMNAPQTNMPMMGGQRGYMMNPMMRQQMMQMHQQGGGMPMHGGPGYMMRPEGRMGMMDSDAKNMPTPRGPGNRMGPPGRMGMMGGDGSNMPMMGMMQQRHAEMQAHRQTMEKHMARIEALLQELVNLQKGK